MRRCVVLFGLFLSIASVKEACSAEFFYENFSDTIRSVYSNGATGAAAWQVLIPFTGMPAQSDDPDRLAETYPGHLWNFATSTTPNGGIIYTHANNYCPLGKVPKPIVVTAPPFKDSQNISDFKLTGDITIGPVKITAINAQYLKSVSISIPTAHRMYLPGNLKSVVKNSLAACGSGYSHAINSVLTGKITISVVFNRSLDAGIAATISSTISANLGAHAHVVQYGTADKPLIIQTDDEEVIAVLAVPAALLQ